MFNILYLCSSVTVHILQFMQQQQQLHNGHIDTLQCVPSEGGDSDNGVHTLMYHIKLQPMPLLAQEDNNLHHLQSITSLVIIHIWLVMRGSPWLHRGYNNMYTLHYKSHIQQVMISITKHNLKMVVDQKIFQNFNGLSTIQSLSALC